VNDSRFLLGFPVRYTYYNFYGSTLSNPLFTECRIKIDDKPIQYGKYIHGINSKLEEIDYDEVYGFEVEIKKGLKRQLKIFIRMLFIIRKRMVSQLH
jgi:hypothetical protein